MHVPLSPKTMKRPDETRKRCCRLYVAGYSYGEWSEFTACSPDCGDYSTRSRSRDCVDDASAVVSATLCQGLGASEETEDCDVDECVCEFFRGFPFWFSAQNLVMGLSPSET